MVSQALLSDISLTDILGRLDIRVDWDNDQHQSIPLHGVDSESVIDGLRRLSALLEHEKYTGKI